MKRSLFTVLVLFFIVSISQAQSVTIQPGSVLPKMTTVQRTAIGAAADGTLVFDTNTQSYWFRSAGNWVEINGSGGGPAVPENLEKVSSLYDALSLPNENVTSIQMEINDNGTICIGYKSADKFHIVLRRNGQFERYEFSKGNSVGFKLEINNLDKILMVYDSTISSTKRLKYRMFNGTSWDLNGIASPEFSNITTFAQCLNDNGRAYITWNQPDAVTSRVFLSSFNGTNWTHPANYFDYFNPNWGNASAVNPCSQVSIDMAANNDAMVTWMQQIGSTNHAYKAELTSGVWTKPSASSNFLEVLPNANYALMGVNSKVNTQGKSVIQFSFYYYDIGFDYENHWFTYDIKTSTSWTTNVYLYNYSYPFANAIIFRFEIIETKNNDFFIFTQQFEGFGSSSFITTNLMSKMLGSGIISKYLYNNINPPVVTDLLIKVDINSNLTQQYAINDALNVIGQYQIFESFGSWDNVTFDYSKYEKYINSQSQSTPFYSHLSKISENDRTRAIAWLQDDGTKNRLYLSFID